MESLHVSCGHRFGPARPFVIWQRIKKVAKGTIRLLRIHQVHQRGQLIPEIMVSTENTAFEIPMPVSDITQTRTRCLNNFQKLRMFPMDKLGAKFNGNNGGILPERVNSPAHALA